jgi:hypothetical protein
VTLAQIIDLFDRQRGGTVVPDHTARAIVQTLREKEQELADAHVEIAKHRLIETAAPRKRAGR